jgi:hypothetical protein
MAVQGELVVLLGGLGTGWACEGSDGDIEAVTMYEYCRDKALQPDKAAVHYDRGLDTTVNQSFAQSSNWDRTTPAKRDSTR